MVFVDGAEGKPDVNLLDDANKQFKAGKRYTACIHSSTRRGAHPHCVAVSLLQRWLAKPRKSQSKRQALVMTQCSRLENDANCSVQDADDWEDD